MATSEKPVVSKAEIIRQTAVTTGLTQSAVTDVVNAFFRQLQDAVAAGNRVAVPGFGHFEGRDNKARMGVNPSTGAPMQIEASTTPAFKAATQFRTLVRDAAAERRES